MRIGKLGAKKEGQCYKNNMIDIIAPSGVVSVPDLNRSVNRIRSFGFETRCAPQVFEKHLFFAGSEGERARAFLKAAYAKDSSIVWAARGGSGAARVLSELKILSRKLKKKPPIKTYIGFSDSTAFFDWLNNEWGWHVIHGPMLGTQHIQQLTDDELLQLVLVAEHTNLGDVKFPSLLLEPLSNRKFLGPIQGKIVVGNLSVFHSLLSTADEVSLKNSIWIVEDVSEALYRLDRMFFSFRQMKKSDLPRAIILGEFHDCKDKASASLRPEVSWDEWLARWLKDWETVCPVFAGAPIGHGLQKGYLPYGIKGRIKRDSKLGIFELGFSLS